MHNTEQQEWDDDDRSDAWTDTEEDDWDNNDWEDGDWDDDDIYDWEEEDDEELENLASK